jgi:methanogenic corrinoid protein MtbC1
MNELFEKIAYCVEFGKVNKQTPIPPEMKGEDGADELTKQALEQGAEAGEILQKALIIGMERVGVKFRNNKVFVPQVLMSAKSMSAATVHLKPHFDSGNIKRKGKFVIGTVAGDLHDIGKNIVAMMIEGGGWEVINLGTDVKTEVFLSSIEKNPGCVVGMSALLTTTMGSMENTVKVIKEKFPDQIILIGGAPVNNNFREKIGADYYAADPQGAVEYLNTKITN